MPLRPLGSGGRRRHRGGRSGGAVGVHGGLRRRRASRGAVRSRVATRPDGRRDRRSTPRSGLPRAARGRGRVPAARHPHRRGHRVRALVGPGPPRGTRCSRPSYGSATATPPTSAPAQRCTPPTTTSAPSGCWSRPPPPPAAPRWRCRTRSRPGHPASCDSRLGRYVLLQSGGALSIIGARPLRCRGCSAQPVVILSQSPLS